MLIGWFEEMSRIFCFIHIVFRSLMWETRGLSVVKLKLLEACSLMGWGIFYKMGNILLDKVIYLNTKVCIFRHHFQSERV